MKDHTVAADWCKKKIKDKQDIETHSPLPPPPPVFPVTQASAILFTDL